MRLTAKQIERISKALAEPRRVRLLRQIGAANGPIACSALHATHRITPATMSHHLKELEVAGLVHVARQGKGMCLSLQRDVLRAYLEHLGQI
jgi:ArsR family transcriptional regulator